MVFPVVMYGCESWTVKKAEWWFDAFELWCWRRLLRVPWTARSSSQSILKEISPRCSLKGMMLKLKLRLHFGHLMQRVDTLDKTLMLGGIGGRRRRGQQRMRWVVGYGCEFEWTLGVGDGQGGLACCNSRGHKESDTTEQLNWTELNGLVVFSTFFDFSLNLAIRSSWSEPQSAPSLVFVDCIELLHLWLQRI